MRVSLLIAFALGCAKQPSEIETVVVRPCRVAMGDKTIELEYDPAGRLIARRERRGGEPPSVVYAYRYEGDQLVEQLLGDTSFGFERDAAGHHMATTIAAAAGTKRRTIWRGQRQDGRLVVSQDVRTVGFGADEREVPGTRIEYTYDDRGRVKSEHARLSIGATVRTSYTYGDARCVHVVDPLRLPGTPYPIAPCPQQIDVVDNGHRTIKTPQYRDGRLAQDDDFQYRYDAQGRLERERSLRMTDGSADRVFSYDCP